MLRASNLISRHGDEFDEKQFTFKNGEGGETVLIIELIAAKWSPMLLAKKKAKILAGT